MGTKLRENIKKRVAEHKRKVRKEAKKLHGMGVKQKGISKQRLTKTRPTSCTCRTCTRSSSG
jgi:hypothetical protein